MQQVEPSQKYQVKINRQIVYLNESTSQLEQDKKNTIENNSQQGLVSMINKNPKKQNKWNKWYLPQFVRRQLLRLVFIPLLIVLFLLTIALTFKQNNYQTNDYFYSKNIQINRKIRGVVPPLNQTKQDIFGEYKIGLLQSFSVEDRRMLQNFRVKMWRNETMRVTQIGKEDKCWSIYKLKFYSSTIFIEKKQSHLMNVSVVGNVSQQNDTSAIKNVENELQKDANAYIQNVPLEKLNKTQKEPQNSTSSKLNEATQTSAQTTIVNVTSQTLIKSTKNNQQKQLPKTTQTSPQQQSICDLEKWSKLNQILGNSHIWTFAEGNFYLIQQWCSDNENGDSIFKYIVRFFQKQTRMKTSFKMIFQQFSDVQDEKVNNIKKP